MVTIFEILAVTETVAQPADMNIDGVRVGVGIIAPYIVHELLTSKDAAGEGGHFIQQHELLLRQDGALPVPA